MNLQLPKILHSRSSRALSLVLWLVVIVLILAEGWVLKNSFSVFSSIKQDEPPLPTAASKTVRLNFSAYGEAFTRLRQAENYQPQAPASAVPDVFAPLPDQFKSP